MNVLRNRGVNDGSCKCGKPGASVCIEGADNVLGHQCDECWARHASALERMRADAASLRAREVDERMVERIMCARVGRGEYAWAAWAEEKLK